MIGTQDYYDIIVLALGGNDALRGVDPKLMRSHLDKMLEMSVGKGLRVVLLVHMLPAIMAMIISKNLMQYSLIWQRNIMFHMWIAFIVHSWTQKILNCQLRRNFSNQTCCTK